MNAIESKPAGTLVFDNPETGFRQCWSDGRLVFQIASVLLDEIYGGTAPPDLLRRFFFGADIGPWVSGRKVGDTEAFGGRVSPHQFVRLFQPRFSAMVEDGTKRQTIRPICSRLPVAGDLISCRAWTGKPYRSPQRVLRVSPILNVYRIKLGLDFVECCGQRVSDLDLFAKNDGFQGWADMRSWFIQNHDMVGSFFRGLLIIW